MGKLNYKILILSCLSLFFIKCDYLEGGKSNAQKDGYIHIKTNATYQEVLDSLSPYLADLNSFDDYAKLKDYPNLIKAGRYKIKEGESNESLINKLRAGLQSEIAVRIKNEPTVYHLAGAVAKKFETDSTEVLNAILNWDKVAQEDLTSETVKQFFIPNTYNFYWATSGDSFVNRMYKEYNKFWNKDRKSRAKAMNMTPLEVTVLASIVQMEAPKADEQAKVARAYLNRLKIGKKLEADPTSIYAYKLQNGFNNSIQRVYEKHLNVNSAYNTYITYGLPPAPICLPNGTAIDAVLNPDKHDFIYFCADPDRPGYHSFTSNYAEHKRNAAKYRKWLNKNGIH